MVCKNTLQLQEHFGNLAFQLMLLFLTDLDLFSFMKHGLKSNAVSRKQRFVSLEAQILV